MRGGRMRASPAVTATAAIPTPSARASVLNSDRRGRANGQAGWNRIQANSAGEPTGPARTGGIDIRAICVARPERKVKELSQVVTNSYSVHRALYAFFHGPSLKEAEKGSLIEDGDLEALGLFELRSWIRADHQVVRL